jgi:Secretion system C-terminal sorting domain
MKTKILLILALVAFMGTNLSASDYPTVSIHDLQYVSNPDSNDTSVFFGDTVVVKGLVMTGPRDLWVGGRWSAYIVDPDSFPKSWSGFYIIQHDTFAIGTNFGFVEPGMIVEFTGVVDEFGNFSQVALLTDPLTPINILSANNPLPDPVLLTTADLSTVASAEQWESMFVTIESASIINNAISGNWASMNDASGSTGYIAEYFLWFRDRLNAGTYTWPSSGTNLNITGFIRDETGSPGRVHNINPRDTLDITILSNPPVITDVSRTPGFPKSSDAVVVSASVTDNTSGQTATLHYSVNEAPFVELAMSETVADTFAATIPAQADGDFVRYFISASDGDGDGSILPGDTSRVSGGVFFYNVRDNGLLISDIQSTHGYASDASGYNGYEVTLRGIVMTDSTDRFGDYYIQDAAGKWSGVWINDGTFTHASGDEIDVTGTVEERFGITRLNDITSSVVVNAGVGEFAPVDVTTAEIGNGGANREAYESVLVRVTNLTVTNPFPDSPSNFGEFTVSDGTGDLRIDDTFSAFSGQGNDTTYALDQHIDEITGMGYFSFGNAKLIPRDSNDVSIVTAIETSEVLPNKFLLNQNYPNPFNPTTQIKYQIALNTNVKFVIYDAIGREVKRIINQQQAPGAYTIHIDASSLSSGVYFYRLETKQFTQTRKMLLIK